MSIVRIRFFAVVVRTRMYSIDSAHHEWNFQRVRPFPTFYDYGVVCSQQTRVQPVSPRPPRNLRLIPLSIYSLQHNTPTQPTRTCKIHLTSMPPHTGVFSSCIINSQVHVSSACDTPYCHRFADSQLECSLTGNTAWGSIYPTRVGYNHDPTAVGTLDDTTATAV